MSDLVHKLTTFRDHRGPPAGPQHCLSALPLRPRVLLRIRFRIWLRSVYSRANSPLLDSSSTAGIHRVNGIGTDQPDIDPPIRGRKSVVGQCPAWQIWKQVAETGERTGGRDQEAEDAK